MPRAMLPLAAGGYKSQCRTAGAEKKTATEAAVFFFQTEALAYSNGTSSSATMLMILISGLIAGPAVSL